MFCLIVFCPIMFCLIMFYFICHILLTKMLTGDAKAFYDALPGQAAVTTQKTPVAPVKKP